MGLPFVPGSWRGYCTSPCVSVAFVCSTRGGNGLSGADAFGLLGSLLSLCRLGSLTISEQIRPSLHQLKATLGTRV